MSSGQNAVFDMMFGKPKPAEEQAADYAAEQAAKAAKAAEPETPKSRSTQAYLDSLKEGTP